MSTAPRPLTQHQQELLNVVKATHQTLMIARKTKTAEIERRIAEARIQAAREWDEIEAGIRVQIAAEIAHHESAEDEAIIAAYEAGVPVRRMALDGFGNRLDGAVHAKLRDLRADGRVGNVSGYQGADPDDERAVAFPKPVEIETVLAERTEIARPVFTALKEPLWLVDESSYGAGDGVSVMPVLLKMDERDPYFASIAKNARKGTPYRHATTATLYQHPATGELTVYESKETGETLWDHPVARWVKDNYRDALREFVIATERHA